MKELIIGDAPEPELTAAAEEAGMVPMHLDGLAKVVAGMTTLTELTRVVHLSGAEEVDGPQCPWCAKPRALDSELCSYCGYYISVKCAGCARGRKPDWVACPFCARSFEQPLPGCALVGSDGRK